MKTFQFELDESGELLSWDSLDYDEDEIQSITNKLIGRNLIRLGEKTECDVSIYDDNWVTIEGRVCLELGDDWVNDIWEDFQVNVPF